MFLAPIEPAPGTAARSGECPIRRDLAVLAAGLDKGFLRAGATLATAVETIGRVIGGLDGIAEALDERTAGAAVADMRYVADRLQALPGHQRVRTERMEAVSRLAMTLNGHVLDTNETLRVLSIYGMNIKIAASGEAQFVGFVEGMAATLSSGERHLSGFMAKLKALMDAVASVRQADRLLGQESDKVVPEVPNRLAADAGELTAHLSGMIGLAGKVAGIARSVQGKVAVILGALQVGDSTRQRLEHVVSALHLLEGAGGPDGSLDPAAIGHVDRLLVAQIDAALADFTRETSAMLSSLADLVPDTTGLLDLILKQGDGDTRAFLGRLDQGITDVERLTMRLSEAETRSSAMIQVIADTVVDLSDRLSGVQLIRRDVQDIATNTRLLCRRHGTIGKAVSVIATEIDSNTVKLGEKTGCVSNSIERLREVEISLRGHGDEPARDVGEMLAAALAVVRRACQRCEEATAEGGDDARQLVELLENVSDDLSREMSIKGVLEAASHHLAQRTPGAAMTDAADAALRTLLPEIARLYTMASERDVHAAFLLPGMAVAAAAPIALDDDDDGLF